jgi:ribosomal protein L37AE/L43A
VLQNDKKVSYNDIKTKIIAYERASDVRVLARQRDRLRIDPNESRENKLKRSGGRDAGEDPKALLAADDPRKNKNLKKKHDSPITDKSKKPKCPNCGNKHHGKCNKDLATCSLCKGKGHYARFCINSSATAPKRQQPNNDDKASEAKHKANLKRRERKNG